MNAGIILKGILIMMKITTTKVKGLIMGAPNFVCCYSMYILLLSKGESLIGLSSVC